MPASSKIFVVFFNSTGDPSGHDLVRAYTSRTCAERFIAGQGSSRIVDGIHRAGSDSYWIEETELASEL